jgi:hypothetical protein
VAPVVARVAMLFYGVVSDFLDDVAGELFQTLATDR